MKDTLFYIVSKIVDHPDEIEIEEKQDENGKIVFILSVNMNDMGKIIGKKGRIITAIRDLIRLMASRLQKTADVVIYDKEQPQTEQS